MKNNDFDGHILRLRQALTKLCAAGLKVKSFKFEILKPVRHLEHLVSPKVIVTDSEKVTTVEQ